MKKFVVKLSWSRMAIGSILVAAIACMVACGDDSSASVDANDEPVSEESSSSSVKSSSSGIQNNSSSSEKAKSSSSKDEKETKVSSNSVKSSSSSSVVNCSSSSNAKSSSSSADVQSSSSEIMSNSSSSEGDVSSSSSEDKVNCSVLLEGETGWSWNVPKECRFNPDIDYGTMTDERDGKVYRTVKIGDQVWMAENLNFDPGQGGSGEDKYDWSWCYDNEPKNCDVAGRYYTWAAAIDSVKLANDADNPQDCGYGKECGVASTRSATLVQGVCPTGWHLPSRAEWNSLFTAVGDESTAGKVLKSQTGWYNRGNGTDAFGFSALPAGGRNGDEDYYNEGDYAYFWSSTELNSSYAYRMYLDYGSVSATLSFKNKDDGFSVRCVKDKTPEPSAKSTSK